MADLVDKQFTAFVPDRNIAKDNWRRTVASNQAATTKDAASMPALVKLWYAHCREEPIRSGELVQLAEQCGLMPHVLRKSRLNTKAMRLSHLIGAYPGPYEGLAIVPVEVTGNSRSQWRLKRITAPTSYLTTFCNRRHRLEDGKPIKHECYVIPPKLLNLERKAEDFFRDEAALAAWKEWAKLGDRRERMIRGVAE